MMVSVTAQIDAAALARINALFDRIEREMPRRMGTQIKRAAIYICQSARKDTKVAPKNIRRRPAEYAAIPSPVPPRYVHSNSKHHKLLRRWQLTRKRGTPKETTYQYYVYTSARRNKQGKMVGKNPAAEVRELLQQHGGITRFGLAKRSWGWLAHDIASTSSMGDLSWKRTRGEVRNPRDYVKGLFAQAQDGASANLKNRLDYILDACPESALSAAIVKAANRLEHNLFPQSELDMMAK